MTKLPHDNSAELSGHIGTSAKVSYSYRHFLMDTSAPRKTLRHQVRKVFRISKVRYNLLMSAHVSQAFGIAHCTDSEDLSWVTLDQAMARWTESAVLA